MSRRKNQPETEQAEENGVPAGQNADEVKEQQNDQTGNEPGLANALMDQIEGRKDAELAREPVANPDAGIPVEEAPTHQSITDSVQRQTAENALAVQAAAAANVKQAFVAETRGERLDTFQPQRVENVRVLVESNDHLDRSGNDVRESPATSIVMSDGVDEARMIDVQPAGEIESEHDIGNGIRQTNLK